MQGAAIRAPAPAGRAFPSCTASPVVSHSRTVWSSPPLYRRSPSLDSASVRIAAVWLLSVCMQMPSTGCHTRTCESLPALYRRVPSVDSTIAFIERL